MTRSPRPQDISWFLDMDGKKQIDLEPPYQRRSVWSRKDREFFVDTIMNNLPSPPVFLHKSIDDAGRATYHVVDGKQRLQTIILFAKDKVKIPEDFGDEGLRKKKFSQLHKLEKETFWNYEIVVEMIPDVSAASVKNIFTRINRNSRKLMRQELRHARFEGWMIAFAEAEAERPEWKTLNLSTPARLKRMADVQFISELIEVSIRKEILGFDQDRLDDLYAEYEDLEDRPDFAEDEFKDEFEATKGLVIKLTEEQPQLLNLIKAQNHFFSLWGYLNTEKDKLLPPKDLAARLFAFFEAAANATAALKNNAHVPEASIVEQEAKKFAINAQGASTEPPQRQARHEALIQAMQA